MTHLEILVAFETEINEIDNELTKPVTDDSLYWINQAIGKFVKTRFNGDQTHHTGYEQTEKRRDDLVKLFKQEDLNVENKHKYATYDRYYVEYPPKFLYALNEDVVISDLNGEHKLDTCVFECTQDSFMYRINNSLTDFHYRFHRARPIRTRTVDGCYLYTDKQYKIDKYTLGYLKRPDEVSLTNPTEEYKDFEDYQLHEIVKIAAQMYLENKKNERYQTITNEVLTQE